MQNELDTKQLLRVFEKVRVHGTREGEQFHLEGLIGYSDFDGYTIYLEDAKVKMSFGFHNTYHFDYEAAKDLEAFEKKLSYIDKHYD
ncbi:DUF3081 domain-containing protein [Alteromonas sediminis]|uniref:DUF3081 domain-containing protein n=1 Tax=Alteromonas sediminis TaxID=2259342 RepID=A0A3N5Y4W5_9ALTE|nr:DUF3081 family protein [Alteromonas sediminis]RPJ68243.1 DUF3081 domain-containing protein [Alteromonas sediminis]